MSLSNRFFFFFFFFFFTFFPSSSSSNPSSSRDDIIMASSGDDAQQGGGDGDKAPEKAAFASDNIEEKKKRDKAKDVATAILERKKAPNRLVVGASSFFHLFFHRDLEASKSIDRAFLLLNRVVQTFRGVRRPVVSRRPTRARPSSRHRRQRVSSFVFLCRTPSIEGIDITRAHVCVCLASRVAWTHHSGTSF